MSWCSNTACALHLLNFVPPARAVFLEQMAAECWAPLERALLQPHSTCQPTPNSPVFRPSCPSSGSGPHLPLPQWPCAWPSPAGHSPRRPSKQILVLDSPPRATPTFWEWGAACRANPNHALSTLVGEGPLQAGALGSRLVMVLLKRPASRGGQETCPRESLSSPTHLSVPACLSPCDR